MPIAGEVIFATDAPEDSGWLTGSTVSGWTGTGTTFIKYRMWGNLVTIRCVVSKSTSALTVSGDGNVSNTTVATISSSYAPSGNYPCLYSGQTGRTYSGMVDGSGNIKLTAAAPEGGNIAVNDIVSLYGSYLID